MPDDLLDTVEKALDELPDVQTAYETIQREAWVWLRSLLARCREAEDRLGECYQLTGADPDGNENWRLAPHAIEEVRRLRDDHDKAESALTALRQRHAQAVAVATEAIAACRCDTLHHKKSERHSAFERCPVMARLAAWLASEAKARLT